MTKKIISIVLAVLMIVSVCSFTSFAADKNEVYVEIGATGGDGSKKEPLGDFNSAVEALGGKDGTIYILGEADMTKFSAGWDGTITFTAGDDSAVITIQDSGSFVLKGDAIFKDIHIKPGKNTHINPHGTKFTFDLGEGNSFASFFHLFMYGSAIVDEGTFIMKSGEVSNLYTGGYCTSLANGVMGDCNLIVDGGVVHNINLCADSYQQNMTGISIGGNYNIVQNGGEIKKIVISRSATVIEVMGALNFVFNNGIQAPETFTYPEETVAGGVFIVKSAVGGTVMPTSEVGVFEIKADKGKVAQIGGREVYNGKVTLEPGETEVEWVDGEQPESESIKIELTIDSKEIIKNGVKSELDVPAQIVDSRTLVPLRAIFEALGATVEWDGETSTVTSEKDGTKIKLTIGDNNLYVNGEAKALDVPAQIIESRTMVPARAIAEAYGCDVAWNGETRTVTITK